MDLISVIIPVYKVENYLCRCIDSILANTYKNLEVICINDGSPDKCGEILDEYTKKDNRIKVIHQDNHGVSFARNVGLAIAKGNYISFVDPDDWVHERYFEILLEKIKQENCDIAICNYERTSDSFEFLPLSVENVTHERLSLEDMYMKRDYRCYIWGRLYTSKICKNVLFDEDMKVAEDTVFNVKLGVNQSLLKVTHVNATLYSYYSRSGSAVFTADTYVQFDLAKKYIELIRKNKRELINKVIYVNIMKSCLSARYTFSILKYRDKVRECNSIMKESIAEIMNLNFSIREKMKYRLLYYFPQIYRLFRIVDDPSMLIWEKNQRKLKD